MTGLDLGQLGALAGAAIPDGARAVRVSGVQTDSRRVVPGDLFVAIPGARADGATFAAAAVARGARAVLAARPLDLTVPVLVCEDVRGLLGPIAHAIFGEPTRHMPTVAVTGTNGKTTVTHLIEHVLAHCGQRPALLGTIAMRGPAGDSPAELTTPEADAIARFARTQRDAGATHLVMEASSHALDLGRMRGVALEVAAFTNLTQDHLDYHGSMEAYGRAKARLFTDCAPRHSVIMVDSDFGRELARAARGRVHGASVGPVPEAACCVRSFRSSRAGIAALVQTPDGELRLDSPLFGAHNVENLLVALGVARALGLEGPAIAEALRTAHGAQGRMERVEDPRGVLVLVDYAHTPDALVRALEAVRPLTPGRLFVVCGCGGDRDTQKRAPMGAAAARLADIAVLTSDNPRTEDPLTILAELERGARGAGAEVFPLRDLGPSTRRGCAVEPRRDAAIGHVLAAVKPGDTVLIAGKGHETYQIVGETRWPFDDRDVARRAIAACVGG